MACWTIASSESTALIKLQYVIFHLYSDIQKMVDNPIVEHEREKMKEREREQRLNLARSKIKMH